MKMKRITRLVLPVAGKGKRLMPLTRHVPKNLIPANGKPLLEYALEEAVLSGIKEAILIVNPDARRKFERYLRVSGKKFPGLRFHVRKQPTPGGNGHAIVQAYDLLRGEPFAVRFCDDVIVERPPVLQGLIRIFNKYKAPICLLEKVSRRFVSRFGVVGVKDAGGWPRIPLSGHGRLAQEFGGKIYQISKIIEKPAAKDAPSNLTIVGGYILTPSILRNLKSVADTLPIVADDALPLAVALQIELITGGKLYGWEFPGKRLDCGTLEKLRKAEEFLKNRV